MGFFKRKALFSEDLRCSFCNKSQRDVDKLLAGPTVYICNECVDICLDIITHTDESRSSSESKCTLCKNPLNESEALEVEDRGLICPGCVSAIRTALAARE